jgi:hypothetical protein
LERASPLAGHGAICLESTSRLPPVFGQRLADWSVPNGQR